MFLVIGLGNPGKEFEKNRHNVGFRVVQALAESLKVELATTESKAITGRAKIDDSAAILAQPLTFVNASGECVRDLVSKYDLCPADIVAIHDDLDLVLGDVRVKTEGSSGGHKGVDSIIYHLGSEDFGRVRIGIGRPPGRQDPADFVLRDFTAKEEEEIAVAVQEGADAVLDIINRGFQATMNRYNKRQ